MNIKTDNGKYATTIDEHGIIHVTRHGATWREIVGDGYVLSLLYEIDELRGKAATQEAEIANLRRWVDSRQS